MARQKLRKTTADYRRQVREKYGNRIIVVGEYTGRMDRILHKCRKHTVEFLKTPHNLLHQNKVGCPQCGKEMATKTLSDSLKKNGANGKRSHVTYALMLEKKHPELELLSEYKNKRDKITVRCKRCNGKEGVPAASLLKRKNACSRCDVEEKIEERRAAIEKLAWPLQQKLFYTPRQIAHILGMSPDSIKGVLARKQKELRSKYPNNRRVALQRLYLDRSLDEESKDLTYAYYRQQAARLTNFVFKNHKDNIRGAKRSKEVHLDHILSVYDAFYKYEKPLSLKIVAHPANLRLMKAVDNIRKSKNSHHTLRDLKKRIKAYEKKRGRVEYPDYWITEYETLKYAQPAHDSKRVQGLRVLAFDPGVRNFAYAMTELYGAGELKKVDVIKSGYVRNTIDDFKPLDMTKSVGLFKNEVEALFKEAQPDVIVMERYQTRGIKGVSGEYISAMIGVVCSMVEEHNKNSKAAVKVKLITAAQWKNRVNAQVSLDQMYAATKKLGPHRLDSILMSMYMFPHADRYSFLNTKLFKAEMRKHVESMETR